MTAAEVAAACDSRARRSGAGWMARCPAHADGTPSLSVRDGRDGRVLLRCWAGCQTAGVVAAVGLRWQDVCGDTRPRTRAEMRRLERERAAREAAESAQRRLEREAARAECDGWQAAQRVAGRLAAVAFAGAAQATPSEAEALATQYHALLGELHELEVAHAA